MIVFVYGTLKRGWRNHRLLEGATFLGTAVTRRRYRMLCVGFPVVLATSPKPEVQLGCVTGELYEVDEAILAQLDRLEGNGRMYQRTRVSLRGPRGRFLAADMYLGLEPDRWRGRDVLPGANGQITWAGALPWDDEEEEVEA